MTGIPPAPLPDLITVDPDPPVQGQELEICFQFREGDPSPINLEVDWSWPGGGSTQTVQVSAEDPCVKVVVPSEATSVVIEDLSGTSADFAAIVKSA